jgi:hypothetical protein
VGNLPRNPKRPVDEHEALRRWTCLAVDQCEDLHAALDAWVEPDKEAPLRVRVEAIYRVSGASFLLAATASHVVSLLDADKHLGRLPYGVHDSVRLVRNVLEHWSEWPVDKLSAKDFRDSHPGVWPYALHLETNDFLVGGVISFVSLDRALHDLYNWLWSPSPSRIYPPIREPTYPYPLV